MAVKTTRAYIKGVDQAPRKVSIVAALVRGRTVADAMVILDHTPRRSALVVKKAMGVKTRKNKKASTKLIVRRRNGK